MLEALNNSDWKEAFAFVSGCPSDGSEVIRPVSVPPGTMVSDEPFAREDVKRVIAAHIEDGEYAVKDCLGAFELVDGRFAMLHAECDTTGWD